ncbi:PREDICTED: probable disease resistance protein At1g58602 [Theobroma cacao]|uniref:Probable disease resistance protein At1g58602 n=1 Tax=Theobroma cacao TaxID=3641 RepID=A0AB32X1N4_THECC|nr:PREDICTED: probable disease resistance protein At1g58602 [Theobroma cacao]
MEEAIVSLAIERISDLLIQEAVFLLGVRDEVEGLKAELERMKSSLKDADKKPDQNELTRTLVRQISDLAYEAEDVIDSFILQVAHRGGFHGIIERFTKPFHLHKIGVKVKAIQTKLEGLSKALPAYNQISGGEGSSSIFEMQQRLRRTYTHVEEEDVVSLQGITNEVLAQLMTEADRPHVVVSIVGMGGIGKTTLAKKVYKHIDVRQSFDCFAWAFISRQCMPREVLHDLLIKLLTPSKEERKLIDKLQENELMEKVYNLLKEKRFLVVFDDIWRNEHWNILKPAFPRGKRGSKILFTTRHKEVALHADPCNFPIELPLLTDDESWKLFRMKAFPGNRTEFHTCLEELEMLGRKMVKKCGGLPLAIATLGGLLATKRSRAQWEMVHKNINAHLNKFQQQDHHYGGVNGILALSYNELPFHLKPCFLYLGHYPEDWEISKKELIQLWIAEGFISPSWESRGMLMEDVAEQYLEELIDRCLVQVGKRDHTGTGVKTCRIHDLLKDLCVLKAQEENFLEIIQPSLIDNDSTSLYVTLTASMARRVAIHPSKRYVSLKGKHPNLRTLLLFQNEELIKFHISKCNDFKFLRVLNLLRNDVSEWHVPSEIGNLHHLRYLKLESSEIILPRSIGKLKSLHTLYLPNANVRIPNILFKLRRLRHIVLGAVFTRHVPLLLRDTLRNIETLKYIRVMTLIENNAVLDLTNIRSLGITFERSKDVEPFLRALIESHRLSSLFIDFEDSTTCSNLEPLSQCNHLSKLYLSGEIQEDPHLSHHVLNFLPANIVKLTLLFSKMNQDPMVVLGKLPNLRILKLLSNSYEGSKMVCSANDFLQLEFLDIWLLSELEEWQIGEGAMPRLQSLNLLALHNLRMFPEGLRYITALQEMKLKYFRRPLVERIQVIDGREGEDFSKVRHIPSIQISDTLED